MTAVSSRTPSESTLDRPASSVLANFLPAFGLSNPHVQTFYGVIRPGRPNIQATVQRKLRFADGDISVLHDNKPEGWKPGSQVALLMHGLSGCHQSGYMVRICGRLLEQGVRVFSHGSSWLRRWQEAREASLSCRPD